MKLSYSARRDRGLQHKNTGEVHKYSKRQILLTRRRIQENFDSGVDEIEEPFLLSSIYTSYRTFYKHKGHTNYKILWVYE